MKKIQINKKKTNTTRSKLGQVSLEFLTTYGWAFIVALIAIGALAYFGVLSPDKFIGKKCVMGQQLRCDAFLLGINATNNQPIINLRIVNAQSSRISVSALGFTNKEAVPLSGCTVTSPTLPVTIMEGEGADFTAACTANTGNFFVGDKNKVSFNVDYYLAKSGASYTTKVSGDVFDQIQKI